MRPDRLVIFQAGEEFECGTILETLQRRASETDLGWFTLSLSIEINIALEVSGNVGVTFAEVQEGGRLQVAFPFGKYPRTLLPGGCQVLGPDERLVHVRPFAVLLVQPGIVPVAHGQDAAGLAALFEGGGMFGLVAAVDIGTGESLC